MLNMASSPTSIRFSDWRIRKLGDAYYSYGASQTVLATARESLSTGGGPFWKVAASGGTEKWLPRLTRNTT
jgi:hypothetical protein